MNFSRVNNIVGWLVCLIACTVYVLTMEATGSFWDCGEFVSSAYKLQIPHPPGAPLFVLLGRFFIVLFGDDPANAARGVNFMNAIASGFTILFLFWTITHFARKLVQKGAELTSQQIFIVMGAGVVGALAYTFSDSFWYSAVEGEVYALSSLFTAIVFWAILKWEHEVDLENKTDGHRFSRADRWIIFIFFMMGLSIGVHLLNLLTIPAVVMVYYFKRYKVTPWGTFFAFLMGCIITGLVQVVIIQWSIKGAGSFDIFFVNSVGLPFFSGFAVYFVLLAALLIAGLMFNETRIKKFTLFPVWLSAIILLFCFPFIKSAGSFVLLLIGLAGIIVLCYYYKSGVGSFLKIGIWSTIFVILGYSTYFTTLIRSSANPSVDMYNVDNPVSLVGYLSREQYGDWPILYGPDFIYRAPFKTTGDLYVKGKDKYEIAGKLSGQDYGAKPSDGEIQEIMSQHPDWDESKIGPHIFPRMYDNGNERNQDMVYRSFGNMEQGAQPTFGNNIRYFINYQFNWMYWRYFMWNFAGKQNDLQGIGNRRDGNWNSGISFVDKMFGHSTDAELPDTAGKKNKASNKLFFLPFALGLIGAIYQFRSRKDFLINFLLFFFTGFAIVIYLNQAGFQPRERDYAYVGSFYAFAVWIGLGVLWIAELLSKYLKGSIPNYLAFGVCLLAVPVLMASQEWDDHDRGKKTLARDLGKDYLESCAKNAILLSFGDNDTYPLWYGQEVQGYRPDMRVVNYSLLGTDWYVNQLRYKVNESDPTDIIFTPQQIEGNNRNIVFTASYLLRNNISQPLQGFDQNKYYDLYTLLKDVTASEDRKYQVQYTEDETASILPVNKVTIPVDIEAVKKSMIFNEGDSIVSELKLDIKKPYLQKNDLAVLAMIAANKWKRPIYFTSTQELEDLGLEKYARLEGLAYRLVPVEDMNNVATKAAFDNVMNKFAYGNANLNGVYYDEENRRHVNSIRQTHALVGLHLAQLNMKDSAQKILRKYDNNVLESNVPYGMTSNRGNFHNRVSMSFLLAAYESGDKELAQKVNGSMKKDLEQQMKYYRSLGDDQPNEQLAINASNYMRQGGGNLSREQEKFVQDIVSSYQMLLQLAEWEKQYKAGGPAANPNETTNPVIGTDSPKVDTTKPNK
jgi:hypothetical protein